MMLDEKYDEKKMEKPLQYETIISVVNKRDEEGGRRRERADVS